MNRHDIARQGPEPALHPVAGDGVADLLADGEADSLQRVVVLAVADEKHESGRSRAPAGVRSKEVGAFPDYA